MKKIETIEITKQQSYVLTLQSFFLLCIGGAIFSSATSNNDLSVNGWTALVVYILTILVHELLHGFGFLLSGAKPKFGVAMAGIMPVAYATANDRVSLRGMLFTAYLPFLALSIFFVGLARMEPGLQDLAMIGFLGNFVGAIGDLWIASKLWKYFGLKEISILDTKHGLEIFSDNSKAIAIGKKATLRKIEREKNNKFTKRWIFTSTFLSIVQVVGPFLLVALGFEGNYKLGIDELYMFETTTGTDGTIQSTSFNLIAPIIIGGAITWISIILEKMIKRTKNSNTTH